MVCHGQLIQLRDLFPCFADRWRKAVFVILRGYMDESYDNEHRIFALRA